MQKILIVIGLGLVTIGLLWPHLDKIPIGRLPGDIVIDKPHLKVYIPVTTAIIVSAVISIIMWLLKK